MKQAKLLEDDCDIVKQQLKLSDTVERIANKFKCITFIDLNIAGVQMKTWKNIAAGSGVTYKNLLHEQNRYLQQAKVIVTARNPNAKPTEFQIQFDIDSSNCQGITGAAEKHNTTEEQTRIQEATHEKEKSTSPENETQSQNLILVIVLASAFLLLVVIILIIFCCLKRRCCRKPTPMKEEVNDIYGTYGRGWDDGEGEYGNGDRVYVTDTNDYYAAS